MATPTTAAYAINLNDLVQAFVAATSAARVLDLNVLPAVNPPMFSDQPTEEHGLFLDEYETLCSAHDCFVAEMIDRLPGSCLDLVV